MYRMKYTIEAHIPIQAHISREATKISALECAVIINMPYKDKTSLSILLSTIMVKKIIKQSVLISAKNQTKPLAPYK